MKKHIQFMKGKKVLSLLLAMIMVLSVASPAFSSMLGIVANAATGDSVELAFNNLFVFEKWATNANSTTVQTLVQNGTDENGNPKYETVVNSNALVKDIQSGSFTLTKNNLDGAETYTCFGGVDSNNFSYYMIDVKPSTSYTFTYHVSGDMMTFQPYVFMYDEDGKYINTTESLVVHTSRYNDGYNRFEFTTTAKTAYIQVRFTISDTTGNVVSATVKDISICETKNLATDNLFDFLSWANNSKSSTITGNTGGSLAIDTENNSFKIINNGTSVGVDGTTATGEIYTYHSMDGANATTNEGFYSMEVEPNTTYNFSYNLENQSNLAGFTPYVFYFNESNIYVNLNASAAANLNGANSWKFTTPAGTRYIQVRFTVPNTANIISSVDVKDIIICKADSSTGNNLFDFDAWANNANSSKEEDDDYAYNDGTITANTETDSIDFSTDITEVTSGALFSGFSLSSSAGYYTIDVEPSTTYTFLYNLVDCNGLGNFEPYVVLHNAEGGVIKFFRYQSPGYGNNSFMFTTTADTASIQISFSITHNNQTWTCTCKDIEIYETGITDVGYPHRMVFTEGSGTYGTLPTPAIPDGKVFAGWYTGEDGTGKLITADTEISYESYTVYPKFETKLDEGGLKIATPATKLTYTLGEKVNTSGLVLEATVTTDGGTNAYKVNSGYRFSPETVATTTGTQTITVTYGGQSVSYEVTVVDSITESVKVNSVATDVAVTNNEYFINLTDENFNRYEITYYSDAYIKATLNTTATDGTTVSEEFFLEPSTKGSFASFIDGFLDGTYYTNISSISFEPLNRDFFTFDLYSVDTIFAEKPTDNMQYQQDNTHKVGIDLSMGGSIAYLEELSGNVVASYYGEGQAAQVDYKSMISGGTQVTEGVNLINRHDPGRFVQQSYYGTREDPYVVGDYNGVTWNYNPVQGGNYMFESSKIIDYRITAGEIYVKTRPLDWGKYSDEFANSKEGDYTDNNLNGKQDEGELVLDPRYGDDYITDSYMEAWYVFEDDMVKTYCRFVDYSGYPSNTTTQELPAFYPVEPLNTFAYYKGDTVWEEENKFNYANAYKENEPDFWGVSTNYNNMLKANDKPIVDPKIENAENWAAFMGSDNENSFGIGIYSAGVTEFHYGTYPQIYVEPKVTNGVLNTSLTSTQFNNADMYEDGVVTMPDMQDATSYIAPVDTMTFESYKPYSYSFYIASGTLHDIREDFRRAKTDDEAAANAETKIAVPETAYMTPSGSDANSTIGQYYVNNILNANNNYSIQTVSERADTMSFGVHINGATKFTVDIVNVTNSSDDIDLYDADGNEVANTHEFALGEHTGYAEFDDNYTLRFNSTGLAPNGKATAKWIITGYDANGNVVGTYTAYTVMYAPGLTVGAVAEGRITSGSNNEISSWITGANGVDHSQRAPLGSFHADLHDSGYFIYDPLVYKALTTPTDVYSGNSHDYIETEYPDNIVDGSVVPNREDDYKQDAYVLQTATNGPDDSRSQSYLGLLKIDKSRYTNTNQIPNLEIGFDALRISSDKNNSLQNYDTYYVLGTAESYTATSLSEAPSGWTHYTSYTNTNSKKAIPFRETVVPAYTVSDDMEGKYIHALNQGEATYSLAGNNYSTAGTSVLLSLTDKAALRDAVTQGYGLAEEKYSEDAYSKFEAELKEAATVLGDPSANQEQIDKAEKELSDAIDTLVNIYYSLKYDNLFSAYEFSQKNKSMTVYAKSSTGKVVYENGSITVSNEYINDADPEAYTNHGSADGFYNVALEPNKAYVFEYDVTADTKAQAFMFFYNSSGGNGDAPKVSAEETADTGYYVQTDHSGTWETKTESNPWFGNFTNSAGTYHYAIKFTTGANTVKAGFRFGNKGAEATKSTFSNIRLVEASKYYEDATYSATEAVYKEYASYGTMVTPTRPGYTFTGWNTAADGSGTPITGADIATTNLSVYSQWTETVYSIIYNANGGAGNANGVEVYGLKEFTLSSGFSLDNHKLLGWAYTANATTPVFTPGQTITIRDIDPTYINSLNDVTLYAVWGNNYSVHFSVNGADSGSPEIPGMNQPYTDDLTLPDIGVVTKTGYTFLGWAFEPSATSPDFTANQTINLSKFTAEQASYINDAEQQLILHAVWKANSYKVTFDANGGSCTTSTANVTYDSDYGTLPTPTRTGYTFTGWFTAKSGGTKVTASTTVSTASDHTLYAQWDANAYTITYDADGGNVDPTSEAYKITGTVTIPTPTREGYTFTNWKVSTAVGNWSANETVNGGDKLSNRYGNVTLVAQWTENKYSIEFNANTGSGSMTDITNIGYDDSVTLTTNAFEKTGYTFQGWSTSANGTVAYTDAQTVSKLATANGAKVTLYAVWKANTYTIAFNANGGSGTMADKTMVYDASASLTANTYTMTDYAFMGWSTTQGGEVVYADGESVKNLTAVNGETITLYAVWAQPIVNVTFDNLVDISAFSDTVNNGALSNETDTGFTITCNNGKGEGTRESAFFNVIAGNTYKVQADIKGDDWDIYVLFYDANGNGVGFSDSTSYFSSNGGAVTTEQDGITYSAEFTAPAGATKACIRVEANGSNNVVRFENIRVHDVKTYTTYVDPVNKLVKYSDTYGTLPTPVREGHIFTGWVVDEQKVDSSTKMLNTTTVYLTSTWSVDTNHIIDDTVVIEYGLPVKIDVLSNDDSANAKAVSAIGTGVGSAKLNNTSNTTSTLTDKATSLTLENGTVTLSDNIVTYTPTSTNFEEEEVFFYEVQMNGGYYYAKVTIIPATSIYFEDTFFEFINTTVDKNGTTYNYNWETLGTSVGEKFQATDRPSFSFEDDAHNVYGYDTAYEDNVTYSGGTAHYVQVDKNAIGKEPSAKFTFTGTGFDLFSVTDNKSGSLRIIVYKHNEKTQYKSYFVNTYFGYDYDYDNNKYVAVAPGDNNENYRAIFQVPVASLHNIGEYGTYDVEIKPIFSSAFDVNKTGSYGIYIDSVRIFDPMGTNNGTANDAYMADGEYAPQYLEIRDTIVTPKYNDDGSFAGDFDVSSLIDANASLFMDGGKTLPSDFGKVGPKNEVYLAKGQSITFGIVTSSPTLPATVQLGMKLTGKGGDTATVSLMNTAYNTWAQQITLDSATEQYHNIEASIDWMFDSTKNVYKTAAPIVIQNTSDSDVVISLTSLKWAFSENPATTVLSLYADEQTPVLAMAALKRVANEETGENPQDTILAKENIAVAFTGEPYAIGDSGTLIITTEQGVAGVTVDGADVLNCETDENGKLKWTYEFTIETSGSVTFDVVARDENGVTSETVYAVTYVEADDTETDGEDTTIPEGDGSDSDDGSGSGITLIPGDELFAYNLVRLIFQFFDKILSMLSGGATV